LKASIQLLKLETSRLIIRIPTRLDAGAMAAFARENLEHFAPWDPVRDEAYSTPEYWQKHLDEHIDDVMTTTSLQFMLVPKSGPDGPFAGHCTVSGITRGPFQAAYVGYGLDRHAVGKGLMEEALRAIISFCFNELNLHRLMANYMPANVRSAKLLRKLGFVPEGFARDYLYLAGAWQDHILTSRTNEDWVGP